MRIAIANDQALTAEILRRTLQSAGHEIAWIARNGAEAVTACARDRPDLILMDLLMPHVDGVEATRRIMASTPCPILIVTAGVVGANASRVFEALGYGAIDAMDTPVVGRAMDAFLAKINNVAWLTSEKRRPQTRSANVESRRKLLAIGASAGGPAAVAAVLAGLPADFSAATVVVQHIDGQFAGGMAEWLGRHSRLPVRLAKEGEMPVAGTVLLAGTNDHLALVEAGRLSYTPEPASYAYRPSVDVFFLSVSQLWLGDVVGVILTGMGRDGAEGLKALRAKGHYTIAQDEATSVVYGMPKIAAATGAAVDILPLDLIAPKIVQGFSRRRQGDAHGVDTDGKA